jgi:hypothetical protein
MYWCQNSEKNTKFVRIKIDTMYGMHLVLVIYISLKKILASSKNISDGKYDYNLLYLLSIITYKSSTK